MIFYCLPPSASSWRCSFHLPGHYQDWIICKVFLDGGPSFHRIAPRGGGNIPLREAGQHGRRFTISNEQGQGGRGLQPDFTGV